MTNKTNLPIELQNEVIEFSKLQYTENGFTREDVPDLMEECEQFLIQSLQKAYSNGYLKGFKNGFNHSAEGYNGEYHHPNIDIEKSIQEAALQSLSKETNENL